MSKSQRKMPRYDVVGRVESEDLSTFPGTIVDLSIHGCKIHYSNPVTVSLENEYTIKITLSENACLEPLLLICQPIWASEDSGATDIGMKFLHSPDTEMLNKYIKTLHEKTLQIDDVKSQILENECQFI